MCYIGECMTPGDPCTGDGDCPDTACPDCPGGTPADGCYCEPSLGLCLPRCPGEVECEYMPDVGELDPVLEWSWNSGTIEPACDEYIAMPVVANLTDDN